MDFRGRVQKWEIYPDHFVIHLFCQYLLMINQMATPINMMLKAAAHDLKKYSPINPKMTVIRPRIRYERRF
jgi:hypothetical protein